MGLHVLQRAQGRRTFLLLPDALSLLLRAATRYMLVQRRGVRRRGVGVAIPCAEKAYEHEEEQEHEEQLLLQRRRAWHGSVRLQARHWTSSGSA